jgi:hypothetical protein
MLLMKIQEPFCISSKEIVDQVPLSISVACSLNTLLRAIQTQQAFIGGTSSTNRQQGNNEHNLLH